MANPLWQPVHEHLLDEDIIAAATDRRPSLARDIQQAQLVLQQRSGVSGDSVFEHLSSLLARILDERPPDLMDYFEEYSRKVRTDRLLHVPNENRLRETFIEPERLDAAQQLLPMLAAIGAPAPFDAPHDLPGSAVAVAPEVAPAEIEESDPIVAAPTVHISDVMLMQFHWQLAGFGYPGDRTYLLSASMRELAVQSAATVRTLRFWGQLHGTEHNYLVLEADLTAGEIERRQLAERLAAAETERLYRTAVEQYATDQRLVPTELLPVRPVTPTYDTPFEYPAPQRHRSLLAGMPATVCPVRREVPAEPTGRGLNRKSYFVCTRLGSAACWTELPPVTPAQVRVARQIRKLLTGRLDAAVRSWPVFPGTERNLLRATIARITASTYVAPAGFYRIGETTGDEDKEEEEEEEEEEEDEDGNGSAVKDNDKATSPAGMYMPHDGMALLAAQTWVHYRPHILPQGRVNWFDAKSWQSLEEGDEHAEEEDEERDDGLTGDEEDDEVADDDDDDKLQIGPRLLAACSEDRDDALPLWQWQRAHHYDRSQPMVVARSLLWPGAMAMVQHRTHDCLYVGWGLKRLDARHNFQPLLPGPVQSEYEQGPEVMEMSDPTVADEEAWRIRNAPPILDEDEGEGEEEFEVEYDE